MCYTGSNGVKECYSDESEPDAKWYHLSNLIINNDSVSLNMIPITINVKGDTVYSASGGGFYYFKGIIYTILRNFKIDMPEVSCDYCGQLMEKNDKGELVPVQRKRTMSGEIMDDGLFIDGGLI